MKRLLPALLLATLAACNANDGGQDTTPPSNVTASGQDLGAITAQPVQGWDVYGGDVSDARPVALATLLADPEAYVGRELVVEGEIDTVCAKKGCWMTMGEGDVPMRVTFADYAFFVPIESAGRTARLQGTFSIETLDVETLKHYLEDAGKFDEAAAVTEPGTELSFVATGVRMRR